MKLYSPMIEKALKIAYDAHHGQTDKIGVPYIYHPIAVAEQMDTEDEIITALLHDVIEDTKVTLADLEREGVRQSICSPIRVAWITRIILLIAWRKIRSRLESSMPISLITATLRA